MQQTANGGNLPSKRPVIAIVDDDSGLLKGLKRLLEACDFKTELFSSGEAFLRHNKTSEIACIVMDIHLDGISGIELRRRLSAAGYKTPVIFMTGLDSAMTYREAANAGCTDYLRKPFSSHALIKSIRKAI